MLVQPAARVHASENRWLLTEVLRHEWGYRGLVVSDWDAVHDRVAALRAGLDLEMPGTGGRTDDEIVAAVRAGVLARSSWMPPRRVLELVSRGSADAPPAPGPVLALGHAPGASLSAEQLTLLGADAHHELAREAAAASITLLRNESGLRRRRGAAAPGVGRGPHRRHRSLRRACADPGRRVIGRQPHARRCPTPAIRAMAGDRVDYAPGYVFLPRSAYQDDNTATLAAHGIDVEERVPLVARRSATLARELQLAEAVQRQARGPAVRAGATR